MKLFRKNDRNFPKIQEFLEIAKKAQKICASGIFKFIRPKKNVFEGLILNFFFIIEKWETEGHLLNFEV